MKILVLHNRYLIYGGEDRVVEQEIKLLENNGHQVMLYSPSNSDAINLYQKIKAVFSMHYSEKSKIKVKEIIKSFAPDIVHVHNFFFLLTPSVFDACNDLNVPVVMTLHNFRIISPNALLMHKSKPDEKSISKSAFWCVFHKCYRNSYFETFLVARMIEYHRRKKTWIEKLDFLITLSGFAKEKFIEGGIPENKLVVKSNFIDINYPATNADKKGDYFVYIGRLSPEKGIQILLKSFEFLTTKLIIAGSGPLENIVIDYCHRCPNIRYVGFLKKDDLYKLIADAKGLILPTLWYEGFPISVLEAFYLETLVICSNIGSLSEIITDSETGLFCQPGSSKDIQNALLWVENNSDKVSQIIKNSKQVFLDKYSAHNNYKLLLNIYNRSIFKY